MDNSPSTSASSASELSPQRGRRCAVFLAIASAIALLGILCAAVIRFNGSVGEWKSIVLRREHGVATAIDVSLNANNVTIHLDEDKWDSLSLPQRKRLLRAARSEYLAIRKHISFYPRDFRLTARTNHMVGFSDAEDRGVEIPGSQQYVKW